VIKQAMLKNVWYCWQLHTVSHGFHMTGFCPENGLIFLNAGTGLKRRNFI